MTAAISEPAPGVWVARSGFCRMNSVIVAAGKDCLLIDPGVSGAELVRLAAFVADRGLRVVAGVSTHPHWDHLLWHESLGSVPRWASATAVAAAMRTRDADVAEAGRYAPGADPGVLGRLTALSADARSVPWDGPTVRLVRHDAHAPGHLGLLIEPAGILVAGDMLSDVEIPLLNDGSADPLGEYRSGLDLLAGLLDEATLLVPGHGAVGDRAEMDRRLELDRRYLDALSSGGGDDDPRLSRAPQGPRNAATPERAVRLSPAYGADWLPGAHAAQRDRYRSPPR